LFIRRQELYFQCEFHPKKTLIFLAYQTFKANGRSHPPINAYRR
jgi:hypothetical protein